MAVSYLVTRGETISQIIDSWEEQQFEILVNDEIAVEYRQVLERLVVREKVDRKPAEILLERLENETTRIPSVSVIRKSPDPKDNRYLACAVDGKRIIW